MCMSNKIPRCLAGSHRRRRYLPSLVCSEKQFSTKRTAGSFKRITMCSANIPARTQRSRPSRLIPHSHYEQPFNGSSQRKGSSDPDPLESFSASDRISRIPPASDRGSDSDPWSARRDFCGFHEFFDRFFSWGAGVGWHSRQYRNVAVWAGRETWRQLHANDGGFGRHYVRAGSADPGDGLACSPPTAGLATGSLLPVRWHVRCWYRHVLYAGPG